MARALGYFCVVVAALLFVGTEAIFTVKTRLNYKNVIPALTAPVASGGLFELTYNPATLSGTTYLEVTNIHKVFMAHVHAGNKTSTGGVVLWLLLGNATPIPYANALSVRGTLETATTYNVTDLLVPPSWGLPALPTPEAIGAAWLKALQDSDLYANVHTWANPAGELRAQL